MKLKIGTKLVLVTEPDMENVNKLLKEIYILYADYVLKNPFYVTEMPIRCELFDVYLQQLINERTSHAKAVPV